MELEERKSLIRNNVKITLQSPNNIGGQSCGMPTYPIVLVSEDLDIQLIISHHRSQLKNSKLALKMFETALNELVK